MIRYFNGHLEVQEMASISSERASKIMGNHVENESNDELEPKLSWIKGGTGAQTGGTPSRQIGGPLSPGGECFAPLVTLPRVEGGGAKHSPPGVGGRGRGRGRGRERGRRRGRGRLGALPLVEGGGAKHSPPGETGQKSHKILILLTISENHQGSS